MATVVFRCSFVLTLLSLLSMPRMAEGQPSCVAVGADVISLNPDTTIDDCFEALRAAATEASVAPAIEKAIAAKTTAVTPSDSFAGRVNDSIANFLPVFQFAVNSVSTADDQRSVTIKLNPWRAGSIGVISSQATVAEPEIFAALNDALVESVRDTEAKALLASAGDFADVTVSAHYGYTRRAQSWSRKGPFFGRDYQLYSPLIEELIFAGLATVTGGSGAISSEIFDVLGRAPCTNTAANIGEEPIAELGEDCWRLVFPLLVQRAQAAVELETQIAGLDFRQLPALIDNQPQLVGTFSYRFADPVVGQEGWSLGINYEVGSYNINTVKETMRRLRSDPLTAYRTVLQNAGGAGGEIDNERKFIAGVTYSEREPYSFTHDYVLPAPDGTSGGVPFIADVERSRSSELRIKAVYTQFLGLASVEPTLLGAAPQPAIGQIALPVPEQRPRLTASLEMVDVDDASLQDQVIGRLSYVLPLTGGLTLPVTLTYANRGELLGEQDEVFAGHVGISYAFDRK